MTYIKYLPQQISFNMNEGSTQLDLVLIYENEGDGLAAFNLLKFQNHVKLTLSTVPGNPLFNFEFEEQDGQEILLSQVVCDRKSLAEVKNKFHLVKSATLSFWEVVTNNNQTNRQIITFRPPSDSSSQQTISGIQSFEVSVR